jgi:AraC-like DNA-binding protein
MKYFFCFILIFYSFVQSFGQGENPFLGMYQKTKTEYRFELMGHIDEYTHYDVTRLRREIQYLNNFEANCRDQEWKEIAKWMYIVLDATILSRDSNAVDYDYDCIFTRLLKLYNQTDNEYVRLNVLRSLTRIAWDGLHNYESAFEYSLNLCKSLEDVPDTCFPYKTVCYLELAERFYYFREYDDAIVWFNKIIATAGINYIYNQKVALSVYNGLGLSYRNKGDLEKSNEYFNKILTFESDLEEWLLDLWSGVAKGNLGYNLFLEEKYDEAIPLLEFSLHKTVQYNDFAYASGPAINLADIYLEKGKYDKAYHYGNTAYDYERKMPRAGRLESIFFFFNKYYTAVNNPERALLYLDSALAEQKKNDSRFNSNQLLRVEQRMHVLEQQAKEQEIQRAKIERDEYKKRFILLLIASVIVLILLFFVVYLYRKKRIAYQSLVIRNQQWANEQHEIIPKNGHTIAKEEISLLIKEVYRLLEEEKIYKDNELNLQALAQMLHTNRTYLSKAINSITETNFSTFINEYRIKEAVKILSDPKYDYFSMDYLAEEVGFSNRFTFSAVFKKTVGITPSEFKKNRKK